MHILFEFGRKKIERARGGGGGWGWVALVRGGIGDDDLADLMKASELGIFCSKWLQLNPYHLAI